MPMEPTERAREKCVIWLGNVIDNPPDRFKGLTVERAVKGSTQSVGFIDGDDLTGEPAELFADHLEEFSHHGANLRYRIRALGTDGKVLAGLPTCSWGLRRSSADARAAKSGGADVAAVTLSRTQGDAFSHAMSLIPKLAEQAAGADGERFGMLLQMQQSHHASTLELIDQSWELQKTVMEQRLEMALADRQGFLETEAGQALMIGAAQALPGLIGVGAALFGEFLAGMRLDNIERRRVLGIVQPEPAAPSQASAVSKAPSEPEPKDRASTPNNDGAPSSPEPEPDPRG